VTAKPKRRWYQFSLRTLLVVMTLASCFLGWLTYERNTVRKRAVAIATIQELGGIVKFDRAQPFRPHWLRPLLGDNSPGEVVEVNMQAAKIRDADLAHVARMTKLKQLYLYNSPITNRGMTHLAGLKELKGLRLDGTQVTDAGLVHLADLQKLEHLDLYNTQVTNDGLTHLAGLQKLRGLRVNKTRVTDQGVHKLKKSLPSVYVFLGAI
jgi:hypothetical protein